VTLVELRNGSSRRGVLRAGAIAGFALMLPGCPLSDEYFVETAPRRPMHPMEMGGRGPGAAGAAGRANGGMAGLEGERPGAGRGGAGATLPVPDYCESKSDGGHVYLLCVPPGMERPNHLDASMRCVTYAAQAGVATGSTMDLVVVDSSDENTLLTDWIASVVTDDRGLVWLGASDVIRERTWVWGRVVGTTQFFTQDANGGGTPYMDRYNGFADGHPDGSTDDEQDCGAFDGARDWQWDDERCSDKAVGFLCEEVAE
jgi:hypothetical protein